MKFSAIALFSVLGYAAAGAPTLSIKVRDGNFDGLDAIDPILSWSDGTTAGEVDLTYGIKASVRPTTDIASLPQRIWGKASTDVSGWGVSARAELDGIDIDSASLEVGADNQEADLSLKMIAGAGKKNINVRSVQATKGFDADGARVTVTPRYDLDTDDKDVVVKYAAEQTHVKVTASMDEQEVTVSQRLDDENRIAPTINSNGDVSVEYERTLSEDSSLTAKLKPNDNLNVKWKDADWTANVKMPIRGANVDGASVSIKREVKF